MSRGFPIGREPIFVEYSPDVCAISRDQKAAMLLLLYLHCIHWTEVTSDQMMTKNPSETSLG